MALECGRSEMPVFSEEVQASLQSYPWPGNVRELKNVVERAVYRSDTPEIEHLDFNPFENPFTQREMEGEESVVTQKQKQLDLSQFGQARIDLDVSYLAEALKQAGGNQREAAKLLGLTYDQLRGLYRKYQDLL